MKVNFFDKPYVLYFYQFENMNISHRIIGWQNMYTINIISSETLL